MTCATPPERVRRLLDEAVEQIIASGNESIEKGKDDVAKDSFDLTSATARFCRDTDRGTEVVWIIQLISNSWSYFRPI